MKLIIDIPEKYISSDTFFYEWIEEMKADECNGKITHLDSVIEDIKAEIQMVMDMYEGCEYIGDKARRDELWHVLEIIDKHIGKVESEDKE